MSKERPFEDITPVPNIKVGYFEKQAYLKIIDRQAEQIDTFAHTIMALQTRIDTLEKNQRPQGKWLYGSLDYSTCSNCNQHNHYGDLPFCPYCSADMRGGKNETN